MRILCRGGVLLQTPLLGADDEVYAVAQGPIAVGGFLGGEGGAGGATVQQNHPTVGIISGGAIVEREISANIVENGSLNLLLLNSDFTSAVRIADAVNSVFQGSLMATDSGTVNIEIPEALAEQEVNFLAAIGSLEVIPDVTARVIINERTGTIVATQNVRISTVAVSHGSLTITIASILEASQPAPLSERGETVVLPSTDTRVEEATGGFKMGGELPHHRTAHSGVKRSRCLQPRDDFNSPIDEKGGRPACRARPELGRDMEISELPLVYLDPSYLRSLAHQSSFQRWRK